jgi:hypothetical protein
MTWTSIEATCDCPDRLESWTAFVENTGRNSIPDAEEEVKNAAREHIESRTHCSIASVEMKIYYEREIKV